MQRGKTAICKPRSGWGFQKPGERAWSWPYSTAPTIPTPWFQTSGLHNWETIHFHCSKLTSLWYFITAALANEYADSDNLMGSLCPPKRLSFEGQGLILSTFFLSNPSPGSCPSYPEYLLNLWMCPSLPHFQIFVDAIPSGLKFTSLPPLSHLHQANSFSILRSLLRHQWILDPFPADPSFSLLNWAPRKVHSWALFSSVCSVISLPITFTTYCDCLIISQFLPQYESFRKAKLCLSSQLNPSTQEAQEAFSWWMDKQITKRKKGLHVN